jgi:hypothetical protein
MYCTHTRLLEWSELEITSLFRHQNMEVLLVCNITAHLQLLHGEPDLHVGPVTKGPVASRQARIWRASLAGIGRPD